MNCDGKRDEPTENNTKNNKNMHVRVHDVPKRTSSDDIESCHIVRSATASSSVAGDTDNHGRLHPLSGLMKVFGTRSNKKKRKKHQVAPDIGCGSHPKHKMKPDKDPPGERQVKTSAKRLLQHVSNTVSRNINSVSSILNYKQQVKPSKQEALPSNTTTQSATKLTQDLQDQPATTSLRPIYNKDDTATTAAPKCKSPHIHAIDVKNACAQVPTHTTCTCNSNPTGFTSYSLESPTMDHPTRTSDESCSSGKPSK